MNNQFGRLITFQIRAHASYRFMETQRRLSDKS